MDGEIRHSHASQIGAALRACRLQEGLSIGDVAIAIRIRHRFLAAIEEGRYEDLPGPTYVVGFLRGYAEFLGLDGDEVIRRYHLEADALKPSANLEFPVPSEDSAVPKGGILLVGAMVAAVAYGAWYFATSRDTVVGDLVGNIPDRLAALVAPPEETAAATDRSGDAQRATTAAAPSSVTAVETAERPATAVDHTPASEDVTATSNVARMQASVDEPMAPAQAATMAGDRTAETIAKEDVPVQVAPAADDATPDGTPGETIVAAVAPEAEANASVASDAPSAASANGSHEGAATGGLATKPIQIRANEASWVEIRNRYGKRVTSQLMEPGDVYEVPEQSGMKITIGNAGGLTFVVDGQPLPPLGGSGVVRRGVLLEPNSLRSAAGIN